MKKDLHPTSYRPVVFQDLSTGTMFLTQSTAKTTETVKYDDGQDYPLVKIHISSASHPFFTGQEKLVDIEGRVDKFKARTRAAVEKRAAAAKRAEQPKKQKEQSAPVKLSDAKTSEK